MTFKKTLAASLIVNMLGINFALAADKPLPPLPQVKQTLPQSSPASIDNDTNAPIIEAESRYIKAGQDLTVELLSTINSHVGKVGQIIAARLLLPVDLNGKVVIPEGSILTGKIIKLNKADNAGRNASVEILFNNIEVSQKYKLPIVGKIKTVDNSGILSGGNYQKQLQKSVAMGATTAAGGTLTGLGIGLLASAATVGSVIGMVIGGVLGFGWLFFKKGKSIDVPAGTKLLVNLKYDVAVTSIGL